MFGLAARRFLLAPLLFVVGLAAPPALYAQSTGELVLQGPVDSVNIQQMTVTILGQPLKVTRTVISGVSPGNLAALIKPDDRTAPYIAKSFLQYVPGATQVFVSGKISEVNRSLGRFRIGSLWIDYTRVLSSSTLTPTVGAAAAVLGTQPVPKGVLLAETAIVYSYSASNDVTTTTIARLVLGSNPVSRLSGLYLTGAFDLTFGPQGEGAGGIIGGGIIGPTPLRRTIDPIVTLLR